MIDHTRQFDIVNPREAELMSVTLVGLGGIGSPTAWALAKMGVGQMSLYDFDTVEDVNVSTQMYSVSDIGNPKTYALITALKGFYDGEIRGHAVIVHTESNIIEPDIFISALDSINARKMVWEAAVRSTCQYYLDARMAAELFQLYVVDMNDTDWYDLYLRSVTEDMVSEDPCTAKATAYTAFIAGGLTAHAVKRIIMEQSVPRFQQFDIKNLSFVVP